MIQYTSRQDKLGLETRMTPERCIVNMSAYMHVIAQPLTGTGHATTPLGAIPAPPLMGGNGDSIARDKNASRRWESEAMVAAVADEEDAKGRSTRVRNAAIFMFGSETKEERHRECTGTCTGASRLNKIS